MRLPPLVPFLCFSTLEFCRMARRAYDKFHKKRKTRQKRLTRKIFSIIIKEKRGYSAVGSAFEWHSKGQGFDSPYLHQRKNHAIKRVFFFVENRSIERLHSQGFARTSKNDTPNTLLSVRCKWSFVSCNNVSPYLQQRKPILLRRFKCPIFFIHENS